MTTNFFSRIGDIRLTSGRFFGFWIALLAIVISLTSCSDDLDVQQSYPFTVEVMPYADKITQGQTVELRFEIKPEGNYTNTLYTIRYFQYDGEGTLKLVDGPVLINKTVFFWKARLSGSTIPPRVPMHINSSWWLKTISALHRGSRPSSSTARTKAMITAARLSARLSAP